jgi:hypothetical protein
MSKKSTRAAILAVVVLAVGLLAGVTTSALAPATTNYYVSAAGSDTNPGTSSGSPWQSLSKVNEADLKPGDTVSFRRGDVWIGIVEVSRNGTAGSAITLKNYGSGSLPTVTGGEGGNCFRLSGNFIEVDGLRATSCGYAGFNVAGDNNIVRSSEASNNTAGIKVSSGSDFGMYANNFLADNNVMNVNTPGTRCGTPQAVDCSDDSGAFGVLINGDDNEFFGNTVIGSTAASSDFGRDGSAFEIYNGNRNLIHHNKAIDNNVFSELGRSKGTADGNTYRYNLVRASCGPDCAEASGLIARGTGSPFGPTNNTVFEFNTVWLNGSHSRGVVCHATCPSSTVIRGNILVANRNALWLDGSGWTEQANVINGPSNVVLDKTSTTAPALFANAPQDLRLTSASPAVDRVGGSPFGLDLDRVQVPQSGLCGGIGRADAGAYEYDSPNC